MEKLAVTPSTTSNAVVDCDWMIVNHINFGMLQNSKSFPKSISNGGELQILC